MIYGLLLSGAVRATAVFAVGLVAYALLSGAAAATRRFVLVLTLGGAVVVPFAAAVGPRWTVAAPGAMSIFAHESDLAITSARGPAIEPLVALHARSSHAMDPSSFGRLEVRDALGFGWLLIAAALLVRVVVANVAAWSLARRATPVMEAPWTEAANHVAGGRYVEVRASAELESPAVVGLLRATILIPCSALDWTPERCRLVLVHEWAHVRRRDVLAQAIADVACAIHWCNPLSWVSARRLRLEREIAADDAVLAEGVRPSQYAEELVAVATSVATPSAALAMAERSSLEERVASILAARRARTPLASRYTALVAALGAALAAAAACTSPEVSTSVRTTDPGVAAHGGVQIDVAIQRAADEEMAAIVTEWAPELATIVVLDPTSGEVLANVGRKGTEAADVASTVAMAPGSTVKALTVAAALESHAITADQRFECGIAPRMYDDHALRDHVLVKGSLDVAHILAVSSNVGTSHIFDALGGANFGVWLRRFHLGEALGVPGAASSTLPAHIETGTFEGALAANGEGLTATPLQMIAVYGAIADDGIYHAPTFDHGGSPGERVVSSETASALMKLLEAPVVEERATATLARVEGVRVTGKTGTTQWTAPDGRAATYGSFIGTADLPSRRLVILVGIAAVREELYGGSSAAPAFARLVKRIRG